MPPPPKEGEEAFLYRQHALCPSLKTQDLTLIRQVRLLYWAGGGRGRHSRF